MQQYKEVSNTTDPYESDLRYLALAYDSMWLIALALNETDMQGNIINSFQMNSSDAANKTFNNMLNIQFMGLSVSI